MKLPQSRGMNFFLALWHSSRIGKPCMVPCAALNALLQGEHTDFCLEGNKLFAYTPQGGWQPVACEASEDSLRNWLLAALSAVGKTWDAKHPFLDACLKTGHRVHVAFPPVAAALLVSFRKLPQREATSGFQKRWGHCLWAPPLLKKLKQGDSLLISGATGSGKTTLLNDLISEISFQERLIALEDTPELAPCHPHFISLLSRPPNPDGFGEVSLRTLLKQSLRMRPDRLFLGECRGAEVLELLQALNTGHRGAMATLHAHSCRDALRRLELLCLLAPGASHLPLSFIRELVSVGIQALVHVENRHIVSMSEIAGKEGDIVLLRPLKAVEAVSPLL